MKIRAQKHVDRLLQEGSSLLDGGRGRDAALAFSRILLDDPHHARARVGLERAGALVLEQERLARARLDEAQAALALGDSATARQRLEQALELGADIDAAQPLLDRLDERSGRLQETTAAPESAPTGGSRASAVGWIWPRHALIAAWVGLFAILAGTAAATWDRVVHGLAEAPRPLSQPAPPVTSLQTPTAGERALAEARRLSAEGDAEGALRVLDGVPPQDPAYPFARQLRDVTERSRMPARAVGGQP